MPAIGGIGYNHAPSCWDKIMLGFKIGFAAGMCIGALYGGYNAYRIGLRGSELLRTTGKTIIGSGSTFGGFMAVGNGIRC